MNPNQAPRSELRHARRPPRAELFHGNLAAVLMVVSLLLNFGAPILSTYMSFFRSEAGLLVLSLVHRGLWIWGCYHLTRYLNLSALWAFAGVLSCIGLPILFLAAREKGKWQRTAHLRDNQPRVRRGDPNSPW